MGKKRVKTIDLSKEEKKVRKKGRIIVKSGKQHGRIADMGAVMLEEMEKRKEEEKKKEKGLLRGGRKPSSEVAGKKKKKVSRPPRNRSQRYLAFRKLVKADKLYPLPEAIELLKKGANTHFEETVELHLNFHPGVQTHFTPGVEKKFPLAHIKIGKLSLPKEKLLQNIQTLFKAIGVNKIKKAVLTSTMSPGIKLSLDDPVKLTIR